MRSGMPISVFLGVTFMAWLGEPLAKNAGDHFAEASALYVQGRLQEAGNAVASGLRENPGDPKLASLDNLLKQLKDQQRQDQNNQGGGQGESDPDKQEDNKDSDKPNESGQNSDPEQNQKQDPKKGDDKEKQDKPEDKPDQAAGQQGDHDKQDQEARDSAQAAAEQPKPGQMSKDDAERLLNSFDQDEKQSQRERQAPKRRVIVEEDW
jgi:Ca-activated chloride channel family protein